VAPGTRRDDCLSRRLSFEAVALIVRLRLVRGRRVAAVAVSAYKAILAMNVLHGERRGRPCQARVRQARMARRTRIRRRRLSGCATADKQSDACRDDE
jgi:hypothetical protein